MDRTLSILSFPKELIHKILFYLCYDDIINFCMTCKLGSTILSDQFFWKKKSVRDTLLPSDYFQDNYMKPYIRYKYLLHNYGRTCCDTSFEYPITFGHLYNSLMNNDLPILKYLLTRYTCCHINIAKVMLLELCIHNSDVEMSKFLLEYFKFNQKQFTDVFHKISSSFFRNEPIRYRHVLYNKNNYEIFEYLLNNSSTNDINKYLILSIVLMFPFSETKFQRIINIGNYNLDQLILSVIKNCSLNQSEYICIVKGSQFFVSISFIEWLLNNHDFEKNTLDQLSNFLIKSISSSIDSEYIDLSKRLLSNNKLTAS